MASAAPGSFTHHVNGIDLRVLDEGEGPAVVMLHGFPDRAEEWRHLGARLRAAGRRTIVPDLRGFGESSAPEGRRAYRIEHVLADLEGLLTALGMSDPVDVIGHDWGAFTGWVWCFQAPARIRRYVALSVGHPRAFLLAGLDQMRRSTYMAKWQVPGVSERLLSRDHFSRLRGWLEDDHPDLDQVVADLSRPGRLTAGLNWYRANIPGSIFRHWARCQVPTLGVWSTRDKFLGERQLVGSAKYVEAPWRYERLEGVGHWMPLEAPDALAEVVIPWLDASVS